MDFFIPYLIKMILVMDFFSVGLIPLLSITTMLTINTCLKLKVTNEKDPVGKGLESIMKLFLVEVFVAIIFGNQFITGFAGTVAWCYFITDLKKPLATILGYINLFLLLYVFVVWDPAWAFLTAIIMTGTSFIYYIWMTQTEKKEKPKK
jgi:hypothetical protein